MTTKPKSKKHVRMIEFEPANDFQEEMGFENMDGVLKVLKLQIDSRHQKNVFTIKYLNEPND